MGQFALALEKIFISRSANVPLTAALKNIADALQAQCENAAACRRLLAVDAHSATAEQLVKEMVISIKDHKLEASPHDRALITAPHSLSFI